MKNSREEIHINGRAELGLILHAGCIGFYEGRNILKTSRAKYLISTRNDTNYQVLNQGKTFIMSLPDVWDWMVNENIPYHYSAYQNGIRVYIRYD